MKLKKSYILAAVLALSASFAIGQAKYSGIYSGRISNGDKILIAITKGGHALGLDDGGEGFRDALKPAKSTINKKGKFKGKLHDGTSVVGKVSSSGKFTATVKEGKRTARISAKRILK